MMLALRLIILPLLLTRPRLFLPFDTRALPTSFLSLRLHHRFFHDTFEPRRTRQMHLLPHFILVAFRGARTGFLHLFSVSLATGNASAACWKTIHRDDTALRGS